MSHQTGLSHKLATLERKRDALKAQIETEQKARSVDFVLVVKLKKQNLALKDQISGLQRRVDRLAPLRRQA